MRITVLSRSVAVVAAPFLLLLGHHPAAAQEAVKKPANSAAPTGISDLFGVGGMAQAASDLRKAGEAFERFGTTLDGVTTTIAESLATMSSEFDPFGYKTAFRTIGQQTEIIQRQSKLIQDLQQQEIDRLRLENQTLKKQPRQGKPQQRKRRQRKPR